MYTTGPLMVHLLVQPRSRSSPDYTIRVKKNENGMEIRESEYCHKTQRKGFKFQVFAPNRK